MAKKFFTDESLSAFVGEIKAYTDEVSAGKYNSSGGNISGHVYLTGAKENSSTSNTSQIVFGTSSNNHVAISSNTNAIVINPDTKSTTNQIVLYLDKPSMFPSGITGNASSATKATKDGSGNVITSTYETKTDASAKLAEAKTYTDTVASGKSDSDHNHDSDYDAKGSASAVQTNLNTVSDALDSHTGNSDIHVTTTNKSNWNEAYTHSTSAHARTDATKVADSTTNGNILINDTETNVYSHPNSGVTAGTYKSVTVNAQGHVTSGTNPTTLAGYGIVDAEPKGSASAALTSAKEYTDTVASTKADSNHNHDSAYDAIGSAEEKSNAALATAKEYTNTKIANLASTTVVDNKISTHNTSTDAHNDIRVLISDLTTKLNNFLDVDDTTSDQLSEVLTLIENNKDTLESLTTSKINVSDIIDNLTTNSSSKVLSAAQGVTIKGLIDDLQTELDGHTHNYAGSSSAGGAATTALACTGNSATATKANTAGANYGTTTSGTGAAYTATVAGITGLYAGSSFTMVPHTVSTSTTPTLNVNNYGAKQIMRKTSSSTGSVTSGYTESWLTSGKPVKVTYDGTYWVADIIKPVAADLSGTLAINKGGTGATTAEKALTNLGLTATATELNTLDGITATVTELNYCDGVTSNIQTQLDAKLNASTIIIHNSTSSLPAVTNGAILIAYDA